MDLQCPHQGARNLTKAFLPLWSTFWLKSLLLPALTTPFASAEPVIAKANRKTKSALEVAMLTDVLKLAVYLRTETRIQTFEKSD